ncbi:hypothetical protein ACKU2Z_12875 [Citrobacter freundii]|nr:hypothetical protein [Citrobacter freundii]
MTKFTKEQCGICAECVPQVDGGSGFTNCADAHAADTAGDKLHLPQQVVKSALAAGMARYGDAMQQLARMEGSSDAE